MLTYSQNVWGFSAAAALLASGFALLGGGAASLAAEASTEPIIPEGVERVPYDPSVFRPDPSYEDKPYDVDAQIEIYGGKTAIDPPRPLLEIGREIYAGGPFQEPSTFLGDKNPLAPHFYVYGDWQNVVGWADNGGVELGQYATRLNLDFDLGITSTERIHAFVRPLDRGGQFTRLEFFGDDEDEGFEHAFNVNLESLFFEGDVGAITQGLTGEFNTLDLPFAVGFMPLLMQNGIWLEDAFVGVAATIPAMNSPALDISNADLTAFFAFDQVDSQAFIDTIGDVANHNVNIFGIAGFVDANQGYWEFGYGYSDGEGILNDFDYHNVTVAFTRRYEPWVSNSLRAIWNVGQDAPGQRQTADGFIFFAENSLITSLPSTLVPYLNLWAGFDRPQGLGQQARGLLKNTGINFDTDAITQFPKLDDTGRNTYGGALGIEYLFNLDQQIVAEFATVQVIEGDNEPGRPALGDQYAFGVRWQLPITQAWIVRADGMYGIRTFDDDIKGVRVELRRKF